MPRSKNNRKTKRRGSTPARTAQPRARREDGGLLTGAGEYAGLLSAMAAPGPLLPPAEAQGKVPADALDGSPAATTADGVPSWAAKVLEELLTVTYWLDPGEHGEPFAATIRFSGRREGVTGKARPGDTFWQEETVQGIVPGSGPVAVTAEVRGIHPGRWTVTARPVTRSVRGYPPPGADRTGPPRAPWPRRVTIPPGPEATIDTARIGRTKVPGIVRFAYASLVGLGVLAGLALQALLLAGGRYPVLGPMAFSALAVAAGALGGKAWYVAVHRGRKVDGWCIQGFVTGAAVAAAAAALAGLGLAPGAYLGSAAPALLIGMAIGRLGCFWAGCCTGRPTASRRGIWSSDRRIGCRREPAQLLEALAALILGVAVLGLVLLAGLPRSGPVAVAGLAGYTVIRQLILGLRAEPRQWRHGRPVTAAAASLALAVSAVLLAVG